MPSTPLAEVRYWLAHARGLLRRGLSSLRSRGWRATWQRVLLQLQPPPPPPRRPLYRPDPATFAPLAVPATAIDAVPRASVVIPVYNHADATLACLRAPWPRTRRPPPAKSSSSTTAAATPPPGGWPRSPACVTTGVPPTAASSPRATTARRWPVANCWCSSTTTRSRSRAGWTRCWRPSPRGRTPAWWRPSCCTPMAGCRSPAAWCSPTAAPGATAASRPPTIRATPTCAKPTMAPARRWRSRARCSRRSGVSTRATRRPTTRTPTWPSPCVRPGVGCWCSPPAACCTTRAPPPVPTSAAG